MLKRSLLVIGTFVALLIVGGATLLSGKQLATVTNWLLPDGWQIQTPDGGIQANLENANLAKFSLTYQNCPLITVDNLAVHWHSQHRVSIDKATLDYQCLTQLPTSDDSSSTFSLTPILAFLPEGEAEIKALHWLNLPDDLYPRLAQLLTTPSYSKFAFFQQKLTALIRQQAVELTAEFANQTLSGNLSYQPSEQEKHNLLFSAHVNPKDLFAIPSQFEGDYHWILPKEIIENEVIREGSSLLSWQTDEQNQLVGDWAFASETAPKNRLNFPFRFDSQTLEIKQGKFYWDWLEDFPLQGFINAKLTPNSFANGDYYPIKTYLRFNLLSQSKNAGKGNIVLESRDGELQADSLNMPFQITGNVKYDDFILYSSLPVAFSGKFEHLSFKFQPKSLLRLVGKQRLLAIHELRFPLAGIQINKHGVNGRLHAVFKGESPDFKNINLHLDGFAKNFKMGQLDFFEDVADKNAVQDLWQWRVWGDTNIHTIASKLNVSGQGNWHQNLVQLNKLSGELGKIHQKGVYIPKTELRLLEPIKFAYEKWQLNGGLQIQSPEISFDYGGKIPSPSAKLQVNGEIENLNLKGELQAEQIKPLQLFARRKLTKTASELIGRLYWKEQSAKVFQPLIPFRQHWLITNGTVRGETAFSASAEKGIIAGGHFAIRNAALSMPNGEAKAIEFNLPYRLQDNEFDFGLKQPIDLKIGQLNIGLPIENIHVKVFGHYPYSRKKPLMLKQLSMNLLDGALSVEQFALPQTQIAYLKLANINFERILELVQYQQIELKGKANATLPFWLEGKPCYVCDGLLTQAVESNLKIQPELMKAISQTSGYSERLLLYLLNDTKITDLRSLINVGPNGEMALDAKLKMQLNQQEKAKINFNYHHKENIFSLWHMINSGSYVEQNLENSIYQQLDKRK
ncbi:YdbH family protein [Actinobacillus equuli subsp. equuli]|uniref:YdbH family protein n=1 Tax=Actinobacillus equuli subsp. equuli TaxID=202947 RepID=A0A9X4G1U1_ACTEU|nr:YdbH family protein [Actinobacillus equuli]MDE8034237.1 YdbH family protein [Actinobacillus equuli subsp. equuli]MDG4947925.1 YdbH family protein [Actinobacillus equuli subsp. haemolyticus]